MSATIESAWPKFPGYRITATPFDGIGRAWWNGTLVAESDRCLVVRESDHLDQLYFPADAVSWTLLEESEHTTVCPFKGEASYWSVRDGGDGAANSVWAYREPFAEVADLAGHVAFYADRFELTVTERWPADHPVPVTKRFPLWGSAEDLLNLMDVVPTGPGRFVAPPYPDPPYGTFFPAAAALTYRNVIEGGQLLGTIVAAASKTAPDKRVTSANALFLRAASFHEPLDVDVEVLRSGRTVTAVDVRLSQGGKLCCAGMALLDVGADEILRMGAPRPVVAAPEDSPHLDMSVEGRDLREVGGSYRAEAGNVGPPEVEVWVRFRTAPPHRYQHQALIAQATTHWTIAAAMRPMEGLSEDDAHVTVSTGPLAVSITFHDDPDVSRWMLYSNPAVYSGHGSSQGNGFVHDIDGRLLASYSVQAMIRPFDAPPDSMGGFQRAM